MLQTTKDLLVLWQKERERERMRDENDLHADPITEETGLCHKCLKPIIEAERLIFHPEDALDGAQFHKSCFNPYEHYYGLDRPID